MSRLIPLTLVILVAVTGNARTQTKNQVVVMDTSMGRITIELFQDKAPITVKNFLQYVNDQYYDGTIFHRVISDSVVQGGGMEAGLKVKPTRDPIKNESSNGLSNVRGTIAMALNFVPDSATSQFFINVSDNRFLDIGKTRDSIGYAVFGRVIKGLDVVDKIRAVPTGKRGSYQNVPVRDVTIESVRVWSSTTEEKNEPKHTAQQRREAKDFPSGKGLFLKSRHRRPNAPLDDFTWSISLSDLKKTVALYDEANKEWTDLGYRRIDKEGNHYSVSVAFPLMRYGDSGTTLDFFRGEPFALQLTSRKIEPIDVELGLPIDDFHKNGWRLLKSDLENRFGMADDNQISKKDLALRVFYYREWRFPEVDRSIQLRLYKGKVLQFNYEFSHILISKPSVAAVPSLDFPNRNVEPEK